MKKKSNLPIYFQFVKITKVKSDDIFSGYRVVNSTILQTSKLLPNTFDKPISNFKK